MMYGQSWYYCAAEGTLVGSNAVVSIGCTVGDDVDILIGSDVANVMY